MCHARGARGDRSRALFLATSLGELLPISSFHASPSSLREACEDDISSNLRLHPSGGSTRIFKRCKIISQSELICTRLSGDKSHLKGGNLLVFLPLGGGQRGEQIPVCEYLFLRSACAQPGNCPYRDLPTSFSSLACFFAVMSASAGA